MSSGAHDVEINTSHDETDVDEASLMATFYCPRHEEKTGFLYEELYRSLVQDDETTSPNFWQSPDGDTFLRRFDPPAAHDTTFIQLALNSGGDTASAWDEMRQRLENLLDTPTFKTFLCTSDSRPAWWGYSLTYTTVLPAGANLDEAFAELPPSVRRLGSSESLYELAQAEMSGGRVSLLRVPLRGEGLAAGTVYLALCPSDKEDEFVGTVLTEPDATLLMPDLIAHKAYHQMRQYRGGTLEKAAEEHASQLREAAEKLIDTDSGNPADVNLDELERAYPRSIRIVSRLKELHISLLRQSHNYDWWRAQMEQNGILEYHRSHLETAVSGIDLLVQRWEYAIESAKAALSIAQVRVDKVQANRQWWTATLFAVVGFALGFRGLLDREAIEKVLEQMPSVESWSGSIFVQLGIQIGIFVVFVVLAILAVIWINRQRLERGS